MARRIRSKVKRQLGTLLGVALYFLALTQFDMTGFEDSQHPLTVWLVLAGAVVVYVVSYITTGIFVALYNRSMGLMGSSPSYRKRH